MYPVKLYRIGSDPEFVFCKIAEWQPVLFSASDIITQNRARGLTSFIGTDGHQATAEIRPSPSYNVRRHLYDIAFALDAIDDYLHTSKKYAKERLSMFALPTVANEPLGGHIHVSFLVNDSYMKLVQDANYFHNGASYAHYNPGRPIPGLTASTQVAMNRHTEDVINGRTTSLAVVLTTLNYLLEPFEKWVQPWFLREGRNARYGRDRGDPIRFMSSPRPVSDKYRDWAYLHYEYRVPSTWLANPWLAYVYLGLTKLTMLNFGRVCELAYNEPTKKLPATSRTNPTYNSHYWQSFIDRFNALWAGEKTLKSADLRELPDAIKVTRECREQWLQPIASIDVSEWRRRLL